MPRWSTRCLLALTCALAMSLAHGAATADPPRDYTWQVWPVGRQAASGAVSKAFPSKLVVGVLKDGSPPLDMLEGDTLTGFGVDYLRMLVGPSVELVPKRYPDMPRLLEAACAGEIDLAMNVARTPEHARCFAFTTPWLHSTAAFVTRSGDTAAATSLERLGRARIATDNGFVLEQALRNRFPHASFKTYETTVDALTAIAAGDADVYAGFTPVVRYQLSTPAFSGLSIAHQERLHVHEQRFAVPASRLALRDRLNEALSAARPAAVSELHSRWLEGGPQVPPDERRRMRNREVTPYERSPDRWSVNALRLLPLVIVFGVLLLVTTRAYLLLQREMRRREHAERVLARQAELQNTMMEMIPYPLVARDLENRYIAVNHAYEETTGLSRIDLLGREGECFAPWGPGNSRRVDDMYRRTLASGEAQRAEFVTAGADGDTRYGIFWTRLCNDSHGAPLCVLGTVIDVSDIRRAELRARETERLLSDVTHSLPAIVFQLRRAPDGRYSFPYLDGDTHRMFGDDGGAQMRVDALDVLRVHHKDRARLIARLERSAERLTPVHVEFRYLATDGMIWVRAEFVPHRADDGAVVWSGYAVDASAEHARADELERARDMAQAASRAKDDFLAMMSHEIRTPMNGVLGLVEVLERTALNVEQEAMVGMVHDSAGALLQILDDLLDYAKIEAGRLAIESEPFDVRELVDGAVGLLAGRAHEKGLKLYVDVDPRVAAKLRGDSVRLRQILFNLLSNAIKFTAEGEVSVAVSVADYDEAADHQRLVLCVEDTGIGIAPEAQARLFEPFVQAESSTTRRFGGTGLGLTICRKLSDLMDGTLALHSEPHKGTRMTLRIDLPVDARSGVAEGLAGKRALVKSDDERTASALMHFGESLGLKMTRVTAADLKRRVLMSSTDVDLIFASGHTPVVLSDTSVPLIRLTADPKPAGYRVAEDDVWLSTNPVSWRSLNAACAMALAGLPTAAARRSTAQAEASPGAPDREKERAAGRLILVAEDHPVNRELIRHQLALLGFACDVVNDGAEALEALEREAYGCLITDCYMPNVSGYDLVRRLREREREGGHSGHGPLPVLGITANTASEDLRLCLEAGMDDCLVKPTRLATLREHLARWFGGTDCARQTAQDGGAPHTIRTARPAADAGATPFEPLDLAHMIQVWGSEAVAKDLLNAFVSAAREDLLALPPLLEAANIQRLREWHHRLAGAVGVLQYPALFAVLETWRRHMDRHTAEQLREEGFALIRQCEAMLDSLEHQAALLA